MAALALGAAGAFVGSFFGPIGTAIGWGLGSALGNSLDPVKQQGPQLQDLHLHNSQYGANIPIIYGTVRLGGNDIWETDLQKHEHTSGGKGGPEVTTFSYSGTWDTGICHSYYKNPAFTGVKLGRTWANGKVVADARPDASLQTGEVPYVFYDGNSAQLPDPTEEGILGAGFVSAYTGLARCVYTDWDLSEWGNVEPVLNFEMSTKCFTAQAVYGRRYRVIEFGMAIDTPTPELPNEPDAGGLVVTMHVLANGLPGPDVTDATLPTSVRFRGKKTIGLDVGVPTYIPAGKSASFELAPGYSGDPVVVEFHAGINRTHVFDNFLGTETVGGPEVPATVIWQTNGANLDDIITEDNRQTLGGGAYQWDDPDDDGFYFFRNQEYTRVTLKEPHHAGAPATAPSIGEGGGPSTQDYTEVTLYSNEFIEVFPTTDDTEAEITHECEDVLLSDVVLDICLRCGLTTDQVDVTRIPFIVRGFVIDGVMTGRAALEAILPVYGVRAVESNGTLKFVPDGLAIQNAVEIPNGKLCARMEDQELPARLQTVRGNDQELPWKVTIKYFDIELDYQQNEQFAERLGTGSNTETVIDVPVYLTKKEAKAVAQSWIDHLWTSRDKHTFYTTREFAYLEPTDVAIVEGIKIRITEKEEAGKGSVIKWSGETAVPSVFVQGGIGATNPDFVPQTVTEPQETELVMLDIPVFADVNRQAVTHAAMQGALRRSWKGASLRKSVDGSTYAEVASSRTSDTIGTALTVLGNYGGPSVDEANVLRVRLGPGGTLTSTTRDGMFAGANMFALGQHGPSGARWEIAHFRDAALVDVDSAGRTIWDLSGLWRGRHGTEWAMKGHTYGDIFVLLPSQVILDALNADYGKQRYYKAVTFGRTADTAEAVTFRSNGVALAPYAPVDCADGFDGSDNLIMRCTPRSRVHGWIPGIDQPSGESTEEYRWRIYEDGSKQSVVRTLTSSVPELTYTTAQQTEDFGDTLRNLDIRAAWNVAKKGAIGWGYDSDGGLPVLVPADIPNYVDPRPSPVDPSRTTWSSMPWVDGTRLLSGDFGPDRIWIIAFTTGSTPSGAGGLVILDGAEYNGPPSSREWTLSPVAGDFGPQLMPGAQGNSSPSVTAKFVVGSGNDFGWYPTLALNSTYYLNIRNQATSYDNVPMFMDLLNVP